MTELLRKLCDIDGSSGDEKAVSDFIISQINGFCDWKTDALGNIIVYKKGKNTPAKKVMLDAHTDEVGLIITNITADGFLKFKSFGINTEALLFRNVKINGNINGVVSGKPIHLLDKKEASKLPDRDNLYIDIGATSKEKAEELVSIGDRAIICGEAKLLDGKIISKALDDRVGCAILIKLIKEYDEYDFCASFSVQEELGLRGAKTATFAINPECAIVLEGTTAADIAEVSAEKSVCDLGKGPAVSFMDGATVYDRDFYNAALNSGILCQPKRAVTGGNDSGAIHLSREGVRTLAISVPCRYIHTASSVSDLSDIKNAYELALFMLDGICSGEIK